MKKNKIKKKVFGKMKGKEESAKIIKKNRRKRKNVGQMKERKQVLLYISFLR